MFIMSDISRFLNSKFIEWQYQTGERKTIDEYAAFLGVSRPLLSMWMSGAKKPGTKNKKLLIERYGDEAVSAFGDDPDLYVVQENWEYFTREERRRLRTEAEAKAHKNVERTPKKRRTSTAE